MAGIDHTNGGEHDGDAGFTRRDILGAGLSATVLAASPALGAPRVAPAPSSVSAIKLKVNGRDVEVAADPRRSLLDLLREQLALVGTKKGCDHGQCGACTVHMDGRRVLSCLILALQADGRDVTTIEGIGGDEQLHPMQQAFIDHDALQCGYCTPGQIMSAIACVEEGHVGSPEEIKEYMSGNLCRCGAYVGIVSAIQDAAPKMRS